MFYKLLQVHFFLSAHITTCELMGSMYGAHFPLVLSVDVLACRSDDKIPIPMTCVSQFVFFTEDFGITIYRTNILPKHKF